MTSNAANIKTFAKNAVAYVKNNGFDGIDIDWEVPNVSQRNGLTTLLRELKSAGGSSFIVSMAAWAGLDVVPNAYDLTAIKDIVDFINVMTYDYARYLSKILLLFKKRDM